MGYTVSGISGFAKTSVLRGIQTIRSSGPHPTVGGKCAIPRAVMSIPMTAKSPDSNARISGQPLSAEVFVPSAWGSGPRRRKNMMENLTMVRCSVNPILTIVSSVLQQNQVDAICTALATILRSEREARGLSMNAVAEAGGLSQQMVSYVERGMRKPTVDTLLRMAHAINVDIAEVLQRAQKAVTKKVR